MQGHHHDLLWSHTPRRRFVPITWVSFPVMMAPETGRFPRLNAVGGWRTLRRISSLLQLLGRKRPLRRRKRLQTGMVSLRPLDLARVFAGSQHIDWTIALLVSGIREHLDADQYHHDSAWAGGVPVWTPPHAARWLAELGHGGAWLNRWPVSPLPRAARSCPAWIVISVRTLDTPGRRLPQRFVIHIAGSRASGRSYVLVIPSAFAFASKSSRYLRSKPMFGYPGDGGGNALSLRSSVLAGWAHQCSRS